MPATESKFCRAFNALHPATLPVLLIGIVGIVSIAHVAHVPLPSECALLQQSTTSKSLHVEVDAQPRAPSPSVASSHGESDARQALEHGLRDAIETQRTQGLQSAKLIARARDAARVDESGSRSAAEREEAQDRAVFFHALYLSGGPAIVGATQWYLDAYEARCAHRLTWSELAQRMDKPEFGGDPIYVEFIAAFSVSSYSGLAHAWNRVNC
jgi:hypothetical protein